MDKVLVNHNHASVAAMRGPQDVTEYMVRVGCDRLETWRFGVRSLKCQNETAEITLQNTVDNSTKHQGIRMTVWVTVNHPSKSRRNRHV